jgi:hypothetical protein
MYKNKKDTTEVKGLKDFTWKRVENIPVGINYTTSR